MNNDSDSLNPDLGQNPLTENDQATDASRGQCEYCSFHFGTYTFTPWVNYLEMLTKAGSV